MVATALRVHAEAGGPEQVGDAPTVKILDVSPRLAASNGHASTRPPTPATDGGALPEHAARMLLTRSLSADGTLDVVSVRLELELDVLTLPEMQTLGLNALKLETGIIETYFAAHPAVAAPPAPANGASAAGQPTDEEAAAAVAARLLEIGKTENSVYFINVKVGAQTARLFGSARKLVAQLARAGLDLTPEAISEKLALNFDCRATTKLSANGRYLQVVKLFPAA